MPLVGSLPDGYRVREIEGRLFLFDPRGILLPGPKDPSLIEAYAWRHAWRQVARELNEELADVHAGVRSLHSSRRLRQYMRMMDAVGQAAEAREERPVRRRVVAWGLFAASAAAAAAVLLFTSFGTPPPENPHPAASSQGAFAGKQAATGSTAQRRGSARARAGSSAAETSRGAVSVARFGRQALALGENAISFGKFVNRTTADTMMHFIRSKGYIVYVARIGEDFWVVTRSYHTRAQAERLVAALQEIRLPAQLANAHEVGGAPRPGHSAGVSARLTSDR